MSESTVTKGEFAILCRVDKSRVSHWIKEGKISGEALVGEGRDARIVTVIAQRQLRTRLDSGQRAGNGLNTKLRSAPSPPPSVPSSALEPTLRSEPQVDVQIDPNSLLDDALDEKIKRERLEALQRANRKAAEDEAASQGRYVEAAAMRRQFITIAAQTLRIFEGALPEIASALAATFKVEERDVLLVLNEQVHKVRDQAAKLGKRAAEGLPALVDDAGPAEA